jgi:formylglycine-generating enzyme required for sulfatase activity
MSAPTTRQADGASSFRFLLTQRRRTRGYRERLLPEMAGPAKGDSPSLAMLWIPPGRFWMGSPDVEPERRESEGPQHLVQLQRFFLARTPITQLQWRTVAQWKPGKGEPRWQTQLDPDPSSFKGDQRPVDQVSWYDATEFCRRLSQRTGRTYTLPSEAQWEYACRAGTTTPFHFGATISTELANYYGRQAYGDGPVGEFRRQTTDVASFPANAWGLHDMHGNVWEWCADHWHANYEGAPEDGRPWLEENVSQSESRLLRGGSWDHDPGDGRSAYRLRYHPVLHFNHCGFRVCCLPQD